MRVFLVLLGLLSFISCEKQTIEPMFAKKSLAELHGDGKTLNFTIKVPLTQDTLSFYDASSILEDSSIDKEEGMLKQMYNSLKYSVFQMGVGMGFFNKVKLSFATELPSIDSRYIKSLKVKKIFFALENCEEGEEECSAYNKERKANLNLLDKFFINFVPLKSDRRVSILEDEDPILEEEDFKIEELKAFSKSNTSLGSQVTIARFDNDVSMRRSRSKAKSYSSMVILRMRKNLLKNEKLDQLKELRELKEQSVVKGFSTVGSNLYVELNEPEDFMQMIVQINKKYGSIERFGLRKVERCTELVCAEVEASKSNLVPMLEGKDMVRFDTYFSIKKLEMNDFKYNGFIELEFKFDLGV